LLIDWSLTAVTTFKNNSCLPLMIPRWQFYWYQPWWLHWQDCKWRTQ